MALYENVRDVLFSRRDKLKVKRPPEIETLLHDMQSQQAHFAYSLVDTERYLLPQRRTRVYGCVSQDEQRPDKMTEDFQTAMLLFESFARHGLYIEPFSPPFSQFKCEFWSSFLRFVNHIVLQKKTVKSLNQTNPEIQD